MVEGAAPRLMLIADRFTDPARRARVLEAVEAGVRWVQLRDHEAGDAVFGRTVREVIDRVRRLAPDVRISVNSRPALARELGLGLHAGRGVAAPWKTPGTAAGWVGSSVHGPDEARSAREAGQAYVVFSPIFPTASKPGHPGVGVDALARVCAAVPEVPVYALGGIRPDRVARCLAAGAYGVAVLTGILDAPDIEAAVMAYQQPFTGEDR